jgi:hypothetical protein
VRRSWQRIDPATRTFQALRIWVNGELDGLEQFVDDAVAVLEPAAGSRSSRFTRRGPGDEAHDAAAGRRDVTQATRRPTIPTDTRSRRIQGAERPIARGGEGGMSNDLEFAIKQDIRNNPVVREVDLDQKREFIRMLGWSALAIGTLMFALVPRATRQARIQDRHPQGRLAAEQEWQRAYNLELEEPASPQEIRVARSLSCA